MQITILLENNLAEGHEDLQAEHGLSFYIQHKGHTFLSDVGTTGKFAKNAAALGCDLNIVEAVAISHHHYDHGGGLAWFFKENDAAPVYLKQVPEADYIVDILGMPVKYVGLDKDVLKAHADRIEMINEDRQILPGVHLLTEIPNTYARPGADTRLKIKTDKGKSLDTFEHELVTVLSGEQGLVILTGCAHTGVLNMVAAAQKALPGQPIQAVVGGFHLMREDESTVRKIGETLLAMEIPVIHTGHCTGEKSTRVLADVLGERLQPLGTGAVLEF